MSDPVMPKDGRRAIRPGEILAIRPDYVQEDRGAFFWLFGPSVSQNERIGDVSVVRINGPLEYHDDGWGESYEAIVRRVGRALSGEDCAKRYDEDGNKIEAPELVPPKAVVLRVDSPGGVVAGLDQTITKLRAMSKDAKIPLVAYVDETAYSAGFALCCACSRIVLPKAGFLGSIGVISTMVDVTRADAKAGLRYVVLSSGRHKADGHPHVPITEAMVAEEGPRVMTLAKQFFGAVSRARKIPAKTIQSWEAARFLGAQAYSAGLADDVMGWDAFLSELQASFGSVPKPLVQVRQVVPHSTQGKSAMSIDSLIADTVKAMASEKDPDKLAALASNLGAYKKTKKHIEHTETEEAPDEKDEDEEGDDDEESESKGDETDRSDDPDDDEDDDDDDDDDDDSDKKKAVVDNIVRAAGLTDKSRRADLRRSVTSELERFAAAGPASKVFAEAQKMTGKRSASAVLGALKGAIEGAKGVKERLASLEKQGRVAKKSNAIDAALNARRITKHEAKELRGKDLAFVETFLAMRPKAIIHSDPETLLEPDTSGASAGGGAPKAVKEQIAKLVTDMASRGIVLDPKAIEEDLAKRNAADGGTNGRVI